MVSQTEIEFVYKQLKIFRTNEQNEHFRVPDDALVVQNILSSLYTNSISVCKTN
jgi:hypothetical protein